MKTLFFLAIVGYVCICTSLFSQAVGGVSTQQNKGMEYALNQ